MLTPELLVAVVEELAEAVKSGREEKAGIQGRVCSLNGCPLEFLYKKIITGSFASNFIEEN